MPIFTDKNDLKVTASSENNAVMLEKFGDALLAFSTDAACIMPLADQDLECPLAQAYAAQCYASVETQDGLNKAQIYLKNALDIYDKALPREQKIIRAAQHWCNLERNMAAKSHEGILDDHPTDIISAKWAQAAHFETGNSVGILRAPLKVADCHADNAHLHGMLAFGYEECNMLDEGERAAMRAIALKNNEPWAHHAYAHINEARNTGSLHL